MKKTVLTFGLLSGGILSAISSIMMPLCLNGMIPSENMELIGYATMVLAFVAVFFGIRSYRERHGGGTITFGKAFKVGLLITLITCAVYVIAWEIVYWGFIPDFGDKFAAITLEKMKAGGATPEAMVKAQAEMARFKELYKNPLFNVGITFMEIFPVGLVVTLVSAAILRRKTPGAPAVATA